MAAEQFSSAAEASAFFRQFGGTDFSCLEHHFSRFRATADEMVVESPPPTHPRVLDIGAHWLHQAALLWAADFDVTAVDLPDTLETEWVRAAAARMRVPLVSVRDLSEPVELAGFPDDSFDLVLFSEIIEHITFNPVRFWSEIYRLLRPGGRIIVTTPNYYGAQSSSRWNATTLP